MKPFTGALLVLTVGVLLVYSCTKSTPIGSELVEQDQATVLFSDTFSVIASTILGDSLEVYSPNRQVGNFLCGRYQDPVFGLVESSIYTQLSLDETDEPEFFNQSVINIDSVVLSLVYDTTNVYGDVTAEEQSIQVFRMNEDLERSETYYSNREFATDPTTLLVRPFRFIPKLRDSISVIGYRGNTPDTTLLPPHVRIPISIAFGQALVELDSVQYNTVDQFRSSFMGLHIKAAEDSKAMISYDLLSSFSRLTVYYRRLNDEVSREYNYPFTFQSVKTVNYKHDYAGVDISSFIGNPAMGDSILFVQGMAGVQIKIQMPNVATLENVIINKALLEFTIAEMDTVYESIDRMVLSFKDDDLIFIDDYVFANRLQALDLFGGTPKKDNISSVTRYQMNIAGHLQTIVDGRRDETIIMVPLTRLNFNQSAARTMLFGPGHSTFPAKLKLTYTKL